MNELKIFVYEEFNTIESHLMGYIYYDLNKNIFSFEYNDEWLNNKNITYMFDPNINYYRGRQYPDISKKSIFGFLSDSMPDRWGRLLMQRNENLISYNKKPKELTDIDFILNVYDETRLGAIRFKLNQEEDFVSHNSEYTIPPIVRLRSLESASLAIESDDNIQEKLLLLLAPGSSLGGARPKANVVDEEENIWIAKFPSKKDDYNIGAWEKTAYDLAKLCDIDVPDCKLENFSEFGSTFLSKRFDRNKTKRIHFASAMNLLNKVDGEKNSYLELVDFIKANCISVNDNLKELYKRIIFNILISNTDDHFRNHGFILKENGWVISPMYDINPINYGRKLNTNINLYESDLSYDLVMSVHHYFNLNESEAKELYIDMKKRISDCWKLYAENNGLNNNEINRMSSAFYLADLP